MFKNLWKNLGSCWEIIVGKLLSRFPKFIIKILKRIFLIIFGTLSVNFVFLILSRIFWKCSESLCKYIIAFGTLQSTGRVLGGFCFGLGVK